MISQIGGIAKAYGSKQAAEEPAVANPQARQDLSVPNGDMVKLNGGGEDEVSAETQKK